MLPTRFVKKGAACPRTMVKVAPTPKMVRKGMAKRIDFCATPDLAARKHWRVLGKKDKK